MAFEIRSPKPREYIEFSACLDASFGVRATVKERDRYVRTLANASPLAAFDGGEMIGTLSRQLLDLTVPGATTTPVSAIADIGVIPTHRHRGAMSKLMGRAIEQMHDEEISIGLLHAHDGNLYRQFGFGPATYGARYCVDRSHARLRDFATQDGRNSLNTAALNDTRKGTTKGTVRLLAIGEAQMSFPAIFDDAAREQPGELQRTSGFWEELFDQLDEPTGTSRFFACYEQEGSIDGYLIYEFVPGALHGEPSSRNTHILELCAVTSASYRALFAYILAMEPDGQVTTGERPVDEPLRQLLKDPRALRISALRDRSWLRLIDVPAALEKRRYGSPGTVTFGVKDAQCHWNDDVFRLQVNAKGQGFVERTSTPAELTLEVSDLAAVYLGGMSFSNLAVAASVTEHKEGALSHADMVFYTPRAPYCSSMF